jgi:hypothetical protein
MSSELTPYTRPSPTEFVSGNRWGEATPLGSSGTADGQGCV